MITPNGSSVFYSSGNEKFNDGFRWRLKCDGFIVNAVGEPFETIQEAHDSMNKFLSQEEVNTYGSSTFFAAKNARYGDGWRWKIPAEGVSIVQAGEPLATEKECKAEIDIVLAMLTPSSNN